MTFQSIVPVNPNNIRSSASLDSKMHAQLCHKVSIEVMNLTCPLQIMVATGVEVRQSKVLNSPNNCKISCTHAFDHPNLSRERETRSCHGSTTSVVQKRMNWLSGDHSTKANWILSSFPHNRLPSTFPTRTCPSS